MRPIRIRYEEDGRTIMRVHAPDYLVRAGQLHLVVPTTVVYPTGEMQRDLDGTESPLHAIVDTEPVFPLTRAEAEQLIEALQAVLRHMDELAEAAA